MCRRVLGLVFLALLATTTSAFLLPSAASSSSTTAHTTRCYATNPTSPSSSPLQQLDRLDALRFLAGAVALPALVVLSPGMGSSVGSALALDSSPAEEALTRVIIVKDSTKQLVRSFIASLYLLFYGHPTAGLFCHSSFLPSPPSPPPFGPSLPASPKPPRSLLNDAGARFALLMGLLSHSLSLFLPSRLLPSSLSPPPTGR